MSPSLTHPFADAPAGRGTIVSAEIAYEPPGGDVGRLIAKLFQAEPNIQARHELKRFKQLMEAVMILILATLAVPGESLLHWSRPRRPP